MDKEYEDVFKSMSKAEIIEWINQELSWRSSISLPKQSDILWTRHSIKMDKHLEEQRQNTIFLKSIDGKERDRLANLFNNSTDNDERMKLLEKMSFYHKKFDKYRKESERLQNVYHKLDKEYNKIESLRKEGR